MILRDAAGHVYAERRIEPFEVGTLTVSLLYGTLGLLFYERVAGRTIKLYPVLGGRVFLALLAVGAATALAGLSLSTLRGLRLEHAGLWLLVWLGAAYTAWTPFVVGWGGLGLLLSFGMLLFVPGAVVAVRRGRLIAEVERAVRRRPEGGENG